MEKIRNDVKKSLAYAYRGRDAVVLHQIVAAVNDRIFETCRYNIGTRDSWGMFVETDGEVEILESSQSSGSRLYPAWESQKVRVKNANWTYYKHWSDGGDKVRSLHATVKESWLESTPADSLEFLTFARLMTGSVTTPKFESFRGIIVSGGCVHLITHLRKPSGPDGERIIIIFLKNGEKIVEKFNYSRQEMINPIDLQTVGLGLLCERKITLHEGKGKDVKASFLINPNY